MSIKSIEIICRPCPKCVNLETMIRQTIKGIEMLNRVTIPFDFKHTVDLREINKFSLNVAQTPVILINGVVEFAGKVEPILLKKKFESLHRMG